MKKIFFLLLLFSVGGLCQIEITKSDINTTIATLFEASEKSNYKNACDLIVYIGGEEARNYSGKLNAGNVDDLEKAKRMVKKIKAYLDISDSYEILDSKTITKKDREFIAVDVAFKSGKQVLKMQFQFVNSSITLLLAAIE